jgi:hypothetical protein
MSDVPDLPDAAFAAVVTRITTFLRATPTGQQQPDMDSFCQSVGQRGQRDKRVWDLGVALVALDNNTSGTANLPEREVRAHVQGITTGLLLAQAAGWEPPIPED